MFARSRRAVVCEAPFAANRDITVMSIFSSFQRFCQIENFYSEFDRQVTQTAFRHDRYPPSFVRRKTMAYIIASFGNFSRVSFCNFSNRNRFCRVAAGRREVFRYGRKGGLTVKAGGPVIFERRSRALQPEHHPYSRSEQTSQVSESETPSQAE